MENFFELSYLLACPDTPKMRLDYIKYENKLFIFLLEFGQISTIARESITKELTTTLQNFI